MMNQELIKEKLSSNFPQGVVQSTLTFRDQISVTVSAETILEVCRFLRDDSELAFDFLSFVGGVDRFTKTPRFEVVYQLYSTRHNHRFRIKTLLDEPAEGLPTVDSVTSIWPTADWHERETAEMFGIIFANHPDPRNLLLPDAWTVIL
jgi:NADH-quinone oxidoreductase subunit C